MGPSRLATGAHIPPPGFDQCTIGFMFVHLRLHSEFSTDGQPALALTDLNNLFGAIKFYEAARRTEGKPILGTEVTLETPVGAR